jgi:site-specific DNA-cytosine methylase
MSRKKAKKQAKPSRPVPPEEPRFNHPPRLDAATSLARAADEMAARADRRSKGARHIAADRSLPIGARREAAALLAKTEFVTDPERRSLRWHYEREVRPYSELWEKFGAFERMATKAAWNDERESYWTEIQVQVQKRIQIADAEALLAETKRMNDSFNAMFEYLEPVRDPETKEILRHPAYLDDNVTPHPYAGRPVMPLEMPSLDKFIPAMLKLYDTMQSNRSLIAGRPTLTDDNATDAATARDRAIPVSDTVVEAFTKALLEKHKDPNFDIGDLPDDSAEGNEDVDDGFEG